MLLGLRRIAPPAPAQTDQVGREEDEVQAQADGGHQPQEQQRLQDREAGVSTSSIAGSLGTLARGPGVCPSSVLFSSLPSFCDGSSYSVDQEHSALRHRQGGGRFDG